MRLPVAMSSLSPNSASDPLLPRAVRGLLAAMLLAGLAACTGEPSEPVAPASPPVKPAIVKPAPPKVTHFYAAERTVVRGDDVTVCYGVEDAESVAIKPNVQALKPSRNRCISITPARTTSYLLTARGPGGEDSAECTITVTEPAIPERETMLITTFVASENSVSKGFPVTLCYALEDVETVSIDPPVAKLEPVSRCLALKVEETTTFKLTARRGVETQERQLTVTVH